MSTAAQVLINGVPLRAAAKALPTAKTSPGFWSSPPRPIYNVMRDIYEVRLSSVKSINSVALELPMFPYVCTIEYWDASIQNPGWIGLQATNGKPITIVNQICNPARIVSQVMQQGKGHPQHSISPSHWQHFDLQCKLTQTSRLRVIFTRNVSATPPKDSKGTPLDYSLGVQNFKVGQKVTSPANVPAKPPATPTLSETFASTLDLHGTPVSYALRQNLPRHLLQGFVWRSEPQPLARAVVPFYIDLRDSAGNAQTVDRLYIDPLYSGATMNLYFSNSLPSTVGVDGITQLQRNFSTHDYPIEFPLAQLHGDFGVSNDGITFSDRAPAYVEIDNKSVQFDPRRSWNLMLRIQPNFTPDDTPASGLYTVFDCGAFRIQFDVRYRTFMFSTINAIETLPITDWDLQQSLDFYLVYTAGSGLAMAVNDSDFKVIVGNLINQASTTMRFGARIVANNDDPTLGNFLLQYVQLKQETLRNPSDYWNDWQVDPDPVVVNPYDPQDSSNSTQNALLRFAPQWQNLSTSLSALNPTGFRGGVGDSLDNLVWTPVPRDFKLRKGYFNFPRTKAKFLKLEFTDLTPQPYDSFDPVTRSVKITKEQKVYTSNATQAYNIAPGATRTNMVVGQGGLSFTDINGSTPNLPYVPPSSGRVGNSATELYYASDPALATKLQATNNFFSAQPWQPNGLPGLKFITTSVHEYETINVVHDTKTAFFVGLKAVKAYRVDYLAGNDTEAYYEFFHDDANLIYSDWVLDPNDDDQIFYAATPNADGTFRFESQVFPSTRNVSAVQYASVQTPLVQLLDDNEFNHTDYLGNSLLWDWDGFGDGVISSSIDLLSDVGSTVLVNRTVPPPQILNPHPPGGSQQNVNGPWNEAINRLWGNMQSVYGTWINIRNAVPNHITTYADLSGLGGAGTETIPPTPAGVPTTVLGGIQSRQYVVPRSDRGRMYAAARVITRDALRADLWVQVVTEAGEVLAEDNISCGAGGTYEWWIGYQVGTGIKPDEQKGVIVDSDPDSDTYGYPIVPPGVTPDYLPSDTPLTVRVVQKEPTGDSWYCDNISLFEDPILWEFSTDGGTTYWPVFDIRNNAQGIFDFPMPSNSLCWRVTGFYPNATVSAFEVRPHYGDLLSAIPPRPGLQVMGPNMQPLDDYALTKEDPFFALWDSPIPQEWYINYRLSLFPPQPAIATSKTQYIMPERIIPITETTPPDSVNTVTVGNALVLPNAIVLGHTS